MKLYFAQRGTGDVGPAITRADDVILTKEKKQTQNVSFGGMPWGDGRGKRGWGRRGATGSAHRPQDNDSHDWLSKTTKARDENDANRYQTSAAARGSPSVLEGLDCRTGNRSGAARSPGWVGSRGD